MSKIKWLQRRKKNTHGIWCHSKIYPNVYSSLYVQKNTWHIPYRSINYIYEQRSQQRNMHIIDERALQWMLLIRHNAPVTPYWIGFTPVCILKCILSLHLLINLSLQTSHWNGVFSSMYHYMISVLKYQFSLNNWYLKGF